MQAVCLLKCWVAGSNTMPACMALLAPVSLNYCASSKPLHVPSRDSICSVSKHSPRPTSSLTINNGVRNHHGHNCRVRVLWVRQYASVVGAVQDIVRLLQQTSRIDNMEPWQEAPEQVWEAAGGRLCTHVSQSSSKTEADTTWQVPGT